ncbi:MAG TPA: lytic transglycosylase domain-containing protein [Chitinophagaceae bacterium]|nr:lytic transglycosylase domain-containing protein [Chitinophagaceae bacterium]HMZ45950.1 lytic transglycosylase domain-containing protein [Chitinophagaceae bacterium]HNJ57718.1 lytic transglycosylase domain-containing protein [Chitinophagaceae bacterium]HNM33342.1 lytic transglycosylase domain-containing protein [Chitinophagaceae bacterium]HNN30895.1 lytic transglycosylase domain-containing protein [Chitinophagaceae bacterium]
MQWLLNMIGYPKNIQKTAIVLVGLLVLGFGAVSFTKADIQEYRGRGFYALNDTNSNSLIAELAPKNYYTQNAISVDINPLAVGFMQQYADKQGKWFEKMKQWGKPYLDLYDQILPQYGIPKELKYLSVIESNLNPGTISSAGAVGPWQLMSYEGRKYGLRMTEYNDERMDFYKSTHAACKLLNELRNTFNDWLLVIAAYNGGVGRVKQAMKKAKSKNFWDIQYYLPLETRNHVKKYIATHYIFEGSGGWTTMTEQETNQYIASFALETKQSALTDEEIKNTAIVEVGGRFLSVIIANNLLLDIDQFNKWNPKFDKTLAEGKKYSMRISIDKLPLFEAKKSQILLESMNVLLNDNALVNNRKLQNN